MPRTDVQNTIDAITALVKRQGGSLHIDAASDIQQTLNHWAVAATTPENSKLFKMSIYNFEKGQDEIALYLMINPKDLMIGQVFSGSNAYTRVGWVSTLWGRQQATITASGLSSGFYYISPTDNVGITNFYRTKSAGFINLMSLVSMFKNNGWYFMKANNTSPSTDPVQASNNTLFKDGTSRVISVMDCIRIEYDGSDYLGSFSNFSMSDVATNPFRLEYNFEFIVSSFGKDLEGMDGHLRMGDNDISGEVKIAVQGMNTDFNTTVSMDANELNRYFNMKDIPSVEDTKRYMSGGGEDTVRRVSNVSQFSRKNLSQYLTKNPSVDAKLSEVAAKMGLSKDQLARIIHFESAGTWATQVNNPYSSALGIGQWTNGSAIDMAKILAKDPYNLIKDSSEIKTSEDLVSKFNTVEQQIELFYVYSLSKRVPGGKTLLQAMKDTTNSDDRFTTYMTGHFYPAYVGKSLDEPLPANVQSANLGVLTMRDYTRYVRAVSTEYFSSSKENKVSQTPTNSVGD